MPGKLLFEALALDRDGDASAELEPGRRRQGFAKIAATTAWHDPVVPKSGTDPEEAEMGKVINCECGHVVRGDTEDELIANAEAHVHRDHPDLVGKITRDDLLGMAEET